MNKRLQFLFVVVLALLPLTLSASTWSFGWEKSKKNGGEGFYNFGANKETKDVYTTTLNGLTWHATLEGGQTLAYTSTMGQYFGMASEPCSKAKVWTSDLAGKIKSVKVTARLKDDTFAGNMAVTVNGKAYKLPVYGGTESAIVNGTVVKVIVPQGDFSQAFILI